MWGSTVLQPAAQCTSIFCVCVCVSTLLVALPLCHSWMYCPQRGIHPPHLHVCVQIQAELGDGHVNLVSAQEVMLTPTHLAIVMEVRATVNANPHYDISLQPSPPRQACPTNPMPIPICLRDGGGGRVTHDHPSLRQCIAATLWLLPLLPSSPPADTLVAAAPPALLLPAGYTLLAHHATAASSVTT